jgi:nitronate monooxygenase
LNQRSSDGYAAWLEEIESRLQAFQNPAPYGVNLIVHKTNPRLEADLKITVDRKVPVVITSLGAVPDLVKAVHSYGGLVFHDVIGRRHAEKAVEAGVDGVIAVAAGAGGHAGTISPFALVEDIRSFYDGTVILAGAISTGAQIAAAQLMGADLAYLGTRFIATKESIAQQGFKDMIVQSSPADILYTPAISGVNANFLKPSIIAAGLDPNNLTHVGKMDMEGEAKVWRDVWSAGHGVASIKDVPGAAELCERLIAEYAAARGKLAS